MSEEAKNIETEDSVTTEPAEREIGFEEVPRDDHGDIIPWTGGGTYRRQVDYDRIRAELDIQLVAADIGVYDHGQGRHSFPHELHTDTAKIQFASGKNLYVHHKTGIGGGPIELVAQWQAGKYDAGELTKEEKRAAADWIAEQYDMWTNYEPQRQLSSRIARARRLRMEAQNKPPQLTRRAELAALVNGSAPDEVMDQLRQYCEAADLEWDRVSLAYYVDAICIVPGGIWLGDRILTKPKKEENRVEGAPLDAPVNRMWGGWTKSAAKEGLHGGYGGHLYVVDFDGSDDRKPLISLVNRIVRTLGKRGLPACAVEMTTPDPTDEDRAKMHVSFKCTDDQRASTEDEFEQRHELIDAAIQQVVDQWAEAGDIPEGELGALKRDESMRQLQRLKRLAGCNKEGSDNAVVILQTDKDAYVDFHEQTETRDVRLGDGPPYASSTRWQIGFICKKEKWAYDSDAGKWFHDETATIAREVWPLSIVRVQGSGDYGVRYRYHDRKGRVRYGTLEADAWVDSTAAKNAAGAAAKAGVQIQPRCGGDFCEMLGEWYSEARDVKESTVVRRSGWHDDDGQAVYVNGTQVMGADWYAEGAHTALRGQEKGTLDDWKDAVEETVTTPYLAFALGVSLAGPLLHVLDRDPFGVHLAGASSSGKSRSLYAASSVWGNPRSLIKSWDGTKNGHEIAAQDYSGACMILDELQECDPRHVRKFVYSFADGEGRRRSNRSGTEVVQTRSWSCTALSTGENTITDWIGADHVQGGLTVRMLDVPIERGEVTIDRDHAEAIRERFQQNYGVAGRTFIQWMINQPNLDGVRAFHRKSQDILISGIENGENVRIMEQVAIVYTALALADFVGILPESWAETKEEYGNRSFVEYAVEVVKERIIGSRGDVTTPEARAWSVLQNMAAAQPARFPVETDYDRAHEAFGVRFAGVSEDGKTRRDGLYTTPSMLDASGVTKGAGCTASQLFDWLADQGLVARPDKAWRVGGSLQRWYTVYLHQVDVEEGDAQPLPDLDSLMVDIDD